MKSSILILLKLKLELKLLFLGFFVLVLFFCSLYVPREDRERCVVHPESKLQSSSSRWSYHLDLCSLEGYSLLSQVLSGVLLLF